MDEAPLPLIDDQHAACPTGHAATSSRARRSPRDRPDSAQGLRDRPSRAVGALCARSSLSRSAPQNRRPCMSYASCRAPCPRSSMRSSRRGPSYPRPLRHISAHSAYPGPRRTPSPSDARPLATRLTMSQGENHAEARGRGSRRRRGGGRRSDRSRSLPADCDRQRPGGVRPAFRLADGIRR